MSNLMEYKGLAGKVSFDAQDKTFYGEVIGARTYLSFAGKSATALDSEGEVGLELGLDAVGKVGMMQVVNRDVVVAVYVGVETSKRRDAEPRWWPHPDVDVETCEDGAQSAACLGDREKGVLLANLRRIDASNDGCLMKLVHEVEERSLLLRAGPEIPCGTELGARHEAGEA